MYKERTRSRRDELKPSQDYVEMIRNKTGLPQDNTLFLETKTQELLVAGTFNADEVAPPFLVSSCLVSSLQILARSFHFQS